MASYWKWIKHWVGNKPSGLLRALKGSACKPLGSESSVEHRSWWRVWQPCVYWLVGALFYIYEMVLRASTGVMGHDIRLSFGLSGEALGWLSAMYYWAYTPLQIPCGLLLDRIGVRLLLFGSCVLCALSAGVMAWTDTAGLAAVARWTMGAGSACAFVSCLSLIHGWFSPAWFALMIGLTNSLGSVGGILAGRPLANLVGHFGWRGALSVLSWVGCVLALVIWMVLPERTSVKRSSQQSDDSTTLSQESNHAKGSVIRDLLRNRALWLLGVVGGLLYLPCSAFAELWAVPFVQTTYAVNSSVASNVTMVLHAMNGLSSPLWAALAIRWGSFQRVLSLSAVTECVLFVVIAAARWLPFDFIVLVSAMLGVAMGGQILVFSLAHEYSKPEHVGATHAFLNTVIMGCGLIFQPLLGKMLDVGWRVCEGEVLPNGALVYTPPMYTIAMMVVAVACGGAWFMMRFMQQGASRAHTSPYKNHTPPHESSES